MGATISKPSTETPVDQTTAQTVAAGASVPQSDYIRQVRDAALTKLTGSSGLRMAGDRLSELQPTTSMAEESAKIKYSPEATSKSPSSQYLSYSAAPSRLTGA